MSNYGQIDEKIRVNGIPCQFDLNRISRILKIPKGGELIQDVVQPNKKDKTEIFRPDYQAARGTTVWNVQKSVLLISEWLQFVNQ